MSAIRKTKITKYGNSPGITLGTEVTKALKLKYGDVVDIFVDEQTMAILIMKPAPALEKMFKHIKNLGYDEEEAYSESSGHET
jgi:antitoxin component of MazEF toxin-antitoxin module